MTAKSIIDDALTREAVPVLVKALLRMSHVAHDPKSKSSELIKATDAVHSILIQAGVMPDWVDEVNNGESKVCMYKEGRYPYSHALDYLDIAIAKVIKTLDHTAYLEFCLTRGLSVDWL